jgi:hypothetical protein
MIFMHILDDYCLQGILASMKQKEWWKKREQYKEMYRFDYIVALIMHSFSWSFMIMLPIAITSQWNVSWLFMVLFFVNVITHSFIDDLKANRGKINLWTDQVIHLIQIIVTATILS